MKDHVELRSGAYADSVTLLQVSRAVQAAPGVVAAQVAMATGLNLEVLEGMGFDIPESSPNDMVVALRLDDDADVATALAAVDAALAPTRPASGDTTVAPPRTTGSALRRTGPGAVALVSVPGASATVEAMDALEAGHDVMVFSDNVPVAEEVALKTYAASRGALVMGPDCGTAVIDGVGLGFANAVRPGRIGIVAASGTGCQQLLALLHHAGADLAARGHDGVGVRHALGVGGRDLSAAVGGTSTREALRRLDADADVDLVVVVSKPPAPEVAEALAKDADALDTPVELGLLGRGQRDLTAVAEAVLARLGHEAPQWPVHGADNTGGATGPLLRGLFVGGTLCDESMLMATEALGPIRSNIPLSDDLALGDELLVDDHTMVDFGDDALTQGRAHPMIDPTLRNEQLARAAADPQTGVILLDLVLGHGAEPDPAALLAPAIAAARAERAIPVVVSLVGTDLDPQGLDATRDALVAAGAEVHLSNASATRRALDLIARFEGAAR
ncbi:FdrA family protein [Nocardioides sp. Root122]|uniref:FdrA family protein n=1 Tax=Nocardioides TaxID=1839 RepID=UPI00070271D0|nr:MULTISPECIES: FdrA family protein [Nocardioides]KQV64843.1 FdrA family protein [Nocardioides sp. Root122]MCK9823710.1 FdrA family protein [Nocardioides cavernae]